MDVRELKKIVEIMNQNDLTEIEIEEEGKRLRLKKAGATVTQTVVAAPAPVAMPAAPVPAAAAAGEPAAAAAIEPGHHTITAPMVGTFYRSPSPESDPYVHSGDKVKSESVVCILEAMKVMNEIKAECNGEIVKVCVENGEAVEYGQPLFIVKSA
ncbi:MAG: acetyl-CoA carboxylase biotin carboxyl carrier protein [Planctomycetota bacterium]|nr:acetyl-CoA carboxylase biotin carboxyl carrier protein [Planctomycetota bacterium]